MPVDDMVEVWKNCFATPNLISGMNDGIIYDPDKSSAVCIGKVSNIGLH